MGPWPRNMSWLKWGCLCAACVLGGAIIAMVIVEYAAEERALLDSEMYKEAVRRATSDPAVRRLIGVPMKFKPRPLNLMPWDGDVGINWDGMHVEVSGPVGSGEINVSADQEKGVWNYGGFTVRIKGHNDVLIDLRTSQEKAISKERWTAHSLRAEARYVGLADST